MTVRDTSWTRTGAEEGVLLCCARTRIEAETAERLRRTVEGGINWDRLLRLAQWNSVLPLVHRSLNALCPELVPPHVLAQLRTSFHASSRHNLILTSELIRLLDGLAAHGIQGVPFKGPVLAAEAYGNLALRQFDDLDILLDDRDVQIQRDVMVSLGYEPEYAIPTDAFRRLGQGLSFVRHDGRITVDVHWGIELHWSFSPHLSSEAQYRHLWDRLQSMTLAGREVSTLAPEDSLLLLSVHGAKHRWGSLRWICDIAELIERHDTLDWDTLLATSSALHGRRMLFLALALARDALDAPIPPDVIDRLRSDEVVHSLVGQVRREVFAESRADAETFVIIEPFHLRVMETRADRIRYCMRIAFTPTVEDWVLLPLPGRWFALYYLTRPIRLAAKYGWRVWGRRKRSR